VRVLLSCVALVTIATTANASTIMNVSAVPDGAVAFNNSVIGNEVVMGTAGSTSPRVVAATPSGLLQQFSFFLADPGSNGDSLSFRTGIMRSSDFFAFTPADIVYESAWRTVESDGSLHQIDTNVDMILPAGERYMFFIETPSYSGSSWLLQTNRNLQMVQASMPEHSQGAFGLRSGGGYANWVAGTSSRFDGFGSDADLAMRLTFESVPEPSTLLLLGIGSLGILRRRR
jgi:hypothetical protein